MKTYFLRIFVPLLVILLYQSALSGENIKQDFFVPSEENCINPRNIEETKKCEYYIKAKCVMRLYRGGANHLQGMC